MSKKSVFEEAEKLAGEEKGKWLLDRLVNWFPYDPTGDRDQYVEEQEYEADLRDLVDLLSNLDPETAAGIVDDIDGTGGVRRAIAAAGSAQPSSTNTGPRGFPEIRADWFGTGQNADQFGGQRGYVETVFGELVNQGLPEDVARELSGLDALDAGQGLSGTALIQEQLGLQESGQNFFVDDIVSNLFGSFQSQGNAQGQTGDGVTDEDVGAAEDAQRTTQEWFDDFLNGVVNWGDIPSNVQSDPIFNGERPGTNTGGGKPANVPQDVWDTASDRFKKILTGEIDTTQGANTGGTGGSTGGNMPTMRTVGGVDFIIQDDGTVVVEQTGEVLGNLGDNVIGPYLDGQQGNGSTGTGSTTGGQTNTDTSSSNPSEGDFWMNLLGSIFGSGGAGGGSSTATSGASVGDTTATGGAGGSVGDTTATGGSSTVDIADLIGDISTQGGQGGVASIGDITDLIGNVTGGNVGDVTGGNVGDITVDNSGFGDAFDAIFGDESWLGDVLGAGTNYAAGEAYKEANKETLDFIKDNVIDNLAPYANMGERNIPDLEGQVGVPDIV
ncbi:MAG TPA: hypothetical protein VKP88_00980, partial [Candidatus Paceibacterota bacterium]|nr:hypothetical protein [Candidatus Paceibacterota bacterium]